MSKQELVLPNWHPPQVANGPHGHWSARRVMKQQTEHLIVVHAIAAGWERIAGKVLMSIVLVYPRKYRVDTDNLYARVKHTVDALKGRFFEDDDTEHLDLHVTAIVVKGTKETRISLEAA